MNAQNIKLKKPHTHEGVKYEAGAEITVSLLDAEWMITVGVGELINPEPDNKSGKEAKK